MQGGRCLGHPGLRCDQPRDRKQYARTVKALLADTQVPAKVTIEYEPFSHLGQPHSISSCSQELYGAFKTPSSLLLGSPPPPPFKPESGKNVALDVHGEDRVQYWQARWATGRRARGTVRNLISILSSTWMFRVPRVSVFPVRQGQDLLYLQRELTPFGAEGVPMWWSSSSGEQVWITRRPSHKGSQDGNTTRKITGCASLLAISVSLPR